MMMVVACSLQTASTVRMLAKFSLPGAADLRFLLVGVHDEQLTPEDFVAYITVDVSANWDLIAEDRHRPRPSQLHFDASVDSYEALPSLANAERADI